MLVYFMPISNILPPFGIFYGHLHSNFLIILHIFPRFGILCQEKNLATLLSFPPFFAEQKLLVVIGTQRRQRQRFQKTFFLLFWEIMDFAGIKVKN
jgi:hypothetical protein